jgi:hypothetical protein
MTAGGSLGQSWQVGIDVDEGDLSDVGLRTKWQVCVRNVVQAQAGDKLAKIEKKEALKAQREATTKEAVVKVLETFPHGETARELTRRVGCNAGTLNAALEDLIESGQVEKCKTRKNTGTYDAYRLGGKGADASDATDATP